MARPPQAPLPKGSTCPHCGSVTWHARDDRWVVCRVCQHRFKLHG